ncbi:hypothetical protein D3C76_704080 [compost metagenome]
MLAIVDLDVDEHQAILHGERLFQLRLQILQAGDADTHMTIGLGQLDEIRQRFHVRVRVTAVVAHVLPLAHHTQHAIVQVDDLDRQIVLQAGRQFLDVHLDAAFASDASDILIREAQFHTHGRRETEAHGAQATGVDPAVRLVETVVLGREHLVLTNVRSNKGIAIGNFAQGLDHCLRLDDAAIALIVREHAAIAAPFIDLLPPGIQCCLLWLLADFL